MSGIVGILNRDGAPVDRRRLEEMTSFLSFRGPDALGTWIDGHVGLGHTLLRTTWESVREKQPCSLDGQVWITADARIDGREDLIDQLQAAGCHPSKAVTDPELILHSYHAWHEQCLERLLGDFSFAIWDQRTRRLFCARDHFGVKPFYYAEAGGNFLFSNTLRCIRLSRNLSTTLNDAAIADFLLFSMNQNPATTTFRDIQRLPEGHYLIHDGENVAIRRYWSLPVEEPVFYKRAEEYVEHFRHLLHVAVQDRLRTDRVGVFMSGGLDSTGLAAAAKDILSSQLPSYDLRAYTVVYDQLIPDEERHYAGLAAQALVIPIQFLTADGYRIYERRKELEQRAPELIHRPLSWALSFDQYAMASADCRVVLFGEGPDNALGYEWRGYVSMLFHTFRWKRLIRELGWHARHRGAAQFVGSLASRLRRLRYRGAAKEPGFPLPSWIRPEILKLASRRQGAEQSAIVHPLRPLAHKSMTTPLWRAVFEGSDAGSTSFPVEVRHPYMDIRIVKYLLAIPPIPWCRHKHLLRMAFQDQLPPAILQRGKTPLQEDPLLMNLKRHGLPVWNPEQTLSHYVDPEEVQKVLERSLLLENSETLWGTLRAVSLNLFLAFNSTTTG